MKKTGNNSSKPETSKEIGKRARTSTLLPYVEVPGVRPKTGGSFRKRRTLIRRGERRLKTLIQVF